LKSFASLPRRKSGRGSGKMWEPTEEVDEPSESSEPPSPKKPSQQLDEEEDLRVAPVMSRMLEAQAEMASRSSFDIDIERDSSGPDRTDEGEEEREEEGESSHVTALARKLMEIFDFDEPERVLEGSSPLRLTFCLDIITNNEPCIEYPCWLLKSVLLQGYLYITSKHICFYAYLPKKTVRPFLSPIPMQSKFTHIAFTYQKAENATPSTAVTGFVSKATCCRTIRIPPICTFHTVTLISASVSLLASQTETRKASSSQW
jgi:hypothetical protein